MYNLFHLKKILIMFIFIVLVEMDKKSHKNSNRFLTKQTSKLMDDFCQSTSLHGYSYLSNADSIVAKILWGIVIVAATGLGIAFLVSNTNAYIKATIVTSIESETFPLDVSNFILLKIIIKGY